MAGLKIVDIDVSGRFLIPKDLLAFANLEKQIVLSSSVKMIEIWDKQRYESSITETLKDFGSLAEDVMGNQFINESDDLS
jgi:MraZ protein